MLLHFLYLFHVSDIHCKCFPYLRCHGRQIILLKVAMKEQMNEGIYDGLLMFLKIPVKR